MRDELLDRKIAKIKLHKAIGKIVYGAILLLLVVAILSRLNTILIQQHEITRHLSDFNLSVEQSIEDVEKVATIEEKPLPTTYGSFTITHYCPCTKCCGKSDGITATGTKATAYRTIAVDPKVIPYGTEVVIDGQTYIAEDCGGAVKGNHIDIFVDSHSEAINRGKIEREVFKKEK